MPITKGSRAAHERALKAAETRRRNRENQEHAAYVNRYPDMAEEMAQYRAAPITRKLRSTSGRARKKASPPPFPASYHATPTRHVTRDLKLKQTPKKIKHPYKLPASKRAVKALSNVELQRQFTYWWNTKGGDLPKRRNADVIVYELRDELRRRAESTYGDIPRIKEHRARRGVRKQRGRK